MVNVLKRMRGLQPLFQIRHGEGAAILPPPPLPQLTRLGLQYDRQQWNKSTRPARTFHKEYLPRLKYHNPALPIRVAQGPARLQLTFESPDQDALKRLEASTMGTSEDGEYRATWSAIQSGAQSGAQSTTTAPSPAGSTFKRDVELTLGPHQSRNIWKWFQATTRCEDFPEDPEDTIQMDRLSEFFKQSDIDRQRVKAALDAIRKQRDELKAARDAAARMANEE